MIKYPELWQEYMSMDKKELKNIMPYKWNDKRKIIGTLILNENGLEEKRLPIYKVILNSRDKDDLKIMAWEERERGIAYSDVLEDDKWTHNPIFGEAHDEISIDYIVENLPQHICDAIEHEILDMHWFAYKGIDVNRYYININQYYNNVKSEDIDNMNTIKKVIENNTEANVILSFSV